VNAPKLRVVDDHLLLPAVRVALDQLQLGDEDLAVRRLAEQYASAIDDAHLIAREAVKLAESTDDREKALSALLKRLDAGDKLGELGPKLQLALESLGASPKARAAITGKGKADGGKSAPAKSGYDERRARAAERRARAGVGGATAVDSSAEGADT
jgi:hypothetical protein